MLPKKNEFGRASADDSQSVALSYQDYAVLSGGFISNIDTTSDATYYYFGKAQPGTSNSDALWRIKRMTKSAPYISRFAGGLPTYSNIWNNRASLSYS